MKDKIEEVIREQRTYWGDAVCDALLAVADVSELDNVELAAMLEDMQFGPRVRICIQITAQRAVTLSPIVGEI